MDINAKNIVNNGRLVESNRAPDTYVNGWYPVRHKCSFPGHAEEPRHGKRSAAKIMWYSGYRVVCNYCDREKPPQPEPESGHPPIKRYEISNCESGKPNAYWRFHDPKPLTDTPTLPEHTNMHPTNWFKEQIDFEVRGQMERKARAKRECYNKMKLQKDLDYKRALKEANEMLKQQQKKCAFNQPVHTPIPPMPATPSRTPSKTPILHVHKGGSRSNSVEILATTEPSAVKLASSKESHNGINN